MLAPFTVSVGGVVEKRPCPKLVIGKAKPLPLGNSPVLVTVGTHGKTSWPGSKAPLLSESLIPHEDMLDAQLSFSLTAPLTVYCVFSMVKVQLLHLPESQSLLRDQSQRGKGGGLVRM